MDKRETGDLKMTNKTKDEIAEELKEDTRQAENLDELHEVVEKAISEVKQYSDEYDE